MGAAHRDPRAERWTIRVCSRLDLSQTCSICASEARKRSENFRLKSDCDLRFERAASMRLFVSSVSSLSEMERHSRNSHVSLAPADAVDHACRDFSIRNTVVWNSSAAQNRIFTRVFNSCTISDETLRSLMNQRTDRVRCSPNGSQPVNHRIWWGPGSRSGYRGTVAHSPPWNTASEAEK